jgi:hypothetical protein
MWTVIRGWIDQLIKPRYRPERHYMRGPSSGSRSR